jgi:hypothetical protein
MCIACCDPAKLPKSAFPNCMDLAPGAWATIEISHPSLVIQVGDFGHYGGTYLTAFPDLQPPTMNSQCVYRTQGGASLFLYAPGRWKVYSNSQDMVHVVVLDSYCDAAFQAYVRTGYSQPTHTPITLSAGVSTLALAGNTQRAYALFENNDPSNDVYLSFGPAAVVNSGVLLKANGGSYEMADGNLWRGPVNAISAAGALLLVTEGV